MANCTTKTLNCFTSIGDGLYSGGARAYNATAAGCQTTIGFYQRVNNCLIGGSILLALRENIVEMLGFVLGEQIGSRACSAAFEKIFTQLGSASAMGVSLITAKNIGDSVYQRNLHKSRLTRTVHTTLSSGGALLTTHYIISPILEELGGLIGSNVGYYTGAVAGGIIGGYTAIYIHGSNEVFFDHNDLLNCYVIKIIQCLIIGQINELTKSSDHNHVTSWLNEQILGSLVYNVYSIVLFLTLVREGGALSGYLSADHSLLRKVITPGQIRHIADSISGESTLSFSRAAIGNSGLVNQHSQHGRCINYALSTLPITAAFQDGVNEAYTQAGPYLNAQLTASFDTALRSLQGHRLTQRILSTRNPILSLDPRDAFLAGERSASIARISSFQIEQYIDQYKEIILNRRAALEYHSHLLRKIVKNNRRGTQNDIRVGKNLSYNLVKAPYPTLRREDRSINEIIDTLTDRMPINRWSNQLVELIVGFERNITGMQLAPEGLSEFINILLKIHLGPYLLFILLQNGRLQPQIPREDVIKSIYKNICDLTLHTYASYYSVLKLPLFSDLNTQLKRQITTMDFIQ